MNIKNSILLSVFLLFSIFLLLNGCSNTDKVADKTVAQKTTYPSDIIPFFNHFKLILGDGSNAGYPINFENKDFFYTKNDGKQNWVVYKTPNAGNTHGTSKNRTFFMPWKFFIK